jgi:hypothetical protein
MRRIDYEHSWHYLVSRTLKRSLALIFTDVTRRSTLIKVQNSAAWHLHLSRMWRTSNLGLHVMKNVAIHGRETLVALWLQRSYVQRVVEGGYIEKYTVLVVKLRGWSRHGGPRRRRQDNIKIFFKERSGEDRRWIELAEDHVSCRSTAHTPRPWEKPVDGGNNGFRGSSPLPLLHCPTNSVTEPKALIASQT